jgi:predicted N-acetyltransferase YhbS
MSHPAEIASPVRIRRATPEDAAACGRICYDAFARINTEHNFPPDFPSPAVAAHVLSMMFSHPEIFCVVAEADGKLVGSNCLDERCSIAGVGPITVDPSVQNRRVGRLLMDAVLDRARDQKFAGVRLVQAAFHSRSLSLYSRLGFDVREPLSCFQGPPIGQQIPGYHVRPAVIADLEACNLLCARVHGHQRGGELSESIGKSALVVERHGRITAYATLVGFFGHAVAETNPDLEALIAGAPEFAGPGILVPTRNSELFRWCLAHGLRIVQPMTLMTLGLYNDPAGAYLPSVMY